MKICFADYLYINPKDNLIFIANCSQGNLLPFAAKCQIAFRKIRVFMVQVMVEFQMTFTQQIEAENISKTCNQLNR